MSKCYISYAMAAVLSILITPQIANATDFTTRNEISRTDLQSTIPMEIISTITESRPGAVIPKHFHHGIETGYVLQGAMIRPFGKDPIVLNTGSKILNLRNIAHGGYEVIGDKNLVLFTVHVVDKGKPLHDEDIEKKD